MKQKDVDIYELRKALDEEVEGLSRKWKVISWERYWDGFNDSELYRDLQNLITTFAWELTFRIIGNKNTKYSTFKTAKKIAAKWKKIAEEMEWNRFNEKELYRDMRKLLIQYLELWRY